MSSDKMDTTHSGSETQTHDDASDVYAVVHLENLQDTRCSCGCGVPEQFEDEYYVLEWPRCKNNGDGNENRYILDNKEGWFVASLYAGETDCNGNGNGRFYCIGDKDTCERFMHENASRFHYRVFVKPLADVYWTE